MSTGWPAATRSITAICPVTVRFPKSPASSSGIRTSAPICSRRRRKNCALLESGLDAKPCRYTIGVISRSFFDGELDIAGGAELAEFRICEPILVDRLARPDLAMGGRDWQQRPVVAHRVIHAGLFPERCRAGSLVGQHGDAPRQEIRARPDFSLYAEPPQLSAFVRFHQRQGFRPIHLLVGKHQDRLAVE